MGKMSYVSLHFGYFVGAHPVFVIAVTLAICALILSTFAVKPLVVETDVRRGFASRSSPSALEFQRFSGFYNISWLDLEILAVLIQSKDGDQAALKITPELCDELQRLESFVRSFTVQDNSNQTIRYGEFEIPGGNINYFFNAFKFGYDVQNLMSDNGTNGSIVLSYPHASIYGHVVPLSSHFFGAKVVENFKRKGLATAMESVKVVALFYMLQAHGFAQKYRLRQWELGLFRLSETRNFSDLFDFHIYGDQVADAEMERGNVRAMKLLAVGVIFMIFYMANALRTFTFKTQVLLIFTAISSPLLATAVAFAIVNWFRTSISSITCLTPLLMLGIGVDDAFLLIHSWRHRASMPDSPKRMAIVVTEAGPSITITSVTNALAFGIGTITPSPMMSLFCLCTSVAVTLDYILELTIFAPTLVLSSHWETSNAEIHEKNPPWYSSSYWIPYARFIVSKTGRILTMLILATLYIIAGVGTTRMTATFDHSKTFPSDSRLIHAMNMVTLIYYEYAPANVVVNNPPDISNSTTYANFMGFVSRLENLPESYGPSRTLFWLRDYVKYLDMKNDPAHPVNLTYQYIPEFLGSKLMADKNVVRYHIDDRGSVVVESFVFAIILHGSTEWSERAKTADRIRAILDEYPQYNMTVFEYDATIFDVVTSVKREMFKAVSITLISMAVVCFIFITNLISMFVASLTIFSIFYCLMGLLSLWGLDLDPITMVVVLMAIGFSVDFSAHICYHFQYYDDSAYVYNGCANPRVRKVANIFHVVGTPTIEAGISTILCMLPLFSVASYTDVSFAKTVILVALLGIFHGIMILPALLSLRTPTSSMQTIVTGPSFEPNTIRKSDCGGDAATGEQAPMI